MRLGQRLLSSNNPYSLVEAVGDSCIAILCVRLPYFILKMMKRFLVTALATCLLTFGFHSLVSIFSTWSHATEIPPLEVNLLFNPELDRPTVQPADRDQSDEPMGDGSRAIVGIDEREPVLTREFPWSAVGRLEWQYDGQVFSTCTATLVSENVLLTNAHCLLLPRQNSETNKTDRVLITHSQYKQFLQAAEPAPKLIFKPSMINDIALDETVVIDLFAGWTPEAMPAAEDWALLQVDAPVGKRYGYLGWRNLDLNDSTIVEALAEHTHLIGYSGDFPTESLREYGQAATTAGVDRQCSILGIWPQGALTDTIVHDCDTNPGASGGPILAKFRDGYYYIVGLHARQVPLNRSVRLPNGVDTKVINGGVQVNRWVSAIGNIEN